MMVSEVFLRMMEKPIYSLFFRPQYIGFLAIYPDTDAECISAILPNNRIGVSSRYLYSYSSAL
jgi:hypothetical protein